MEFLSRSIQDEEDSPLSTMRRHLDTLSFYSLAPEGVEVHFVFGIPRVVSGLGASSIKYVLKV